MSGHVDTVLISLPNPTGPPGAYPGRKDTMSRQELELTRRLQELNKPNEERVAQCFACPVCGECRMDRLGWNKAGTVVSCCTCGVDYDPCVGVV